MPTDTARSPDVEADLTRLAEVGAAFNEREAIRVERAELLTRLFGAGLSQRELAERAGMTEDAVQKVIERGRR